MENSNSREYLEKITAAVIDNLRQTGPVPSVQLQDVPRKPLGGMTDEEEAELDDLDEDENKDVRLTNHRWDKRVVNDAEFEASDDEDMSRQNGATRRNGNKRTFTDFRKTEAEADSNAASPANATNGASREEPAAEDSHDINDDTIEDIAATEPAEAEPAQADKEAADSKESEPAKVDNDGDVGMADTTLTEETPKIKKEDADADTAPESTADKAEDEKMADKTDTAEAAATTEAAASKPTEESSEDKAKEPAEEAAPSGDAMEVDEKEGSEEKKEAESTS